MDKVLDALADELAGRVLEKLFETERMKAFLEGRKFTEVNVADIEGLTTFVTAHVDRKAREIVNEAIDHLQVDIDNLDGFDEAVERVIDNGTMEVSFRR